MSMSVSAPVELSIDVEASVEEAFEVFTEDMGSWWPADHHILQAELAEMVFEPKVGGQILDRGVDGSECRWARVLVYDPPNRVVFTWDISLAWQIETDPARTSEVDVRFTPVARGSDPGRPRPSQHRAPRRGMGADARCCRVTRRVGGRSRAVRPSCRHRIRRHGGVTRPPRTRADRRTLRTRSASNACKVGESTRVVLTAPGGSRGTLRCFPCSPKVSPCLPLPLPSPYSACPRTSCPPSMPTASPPRSPSRP